MSDTCDKCGLPLAVPSKRIAGHVVNHEVASAKCRAAAWQRRAKELDLVHVTGDGAWLSVFLLPVYAPVWTGHLSTGAFFPKWAVYLNELRHEGVFEIEDGSPVARAFERAKADPTFAAALASTGDLCETPSDLRKAIALLVVATFRGQQ
jgi:hypothetical protein